MMVIRKSEEADFAAMLAIINDAARAYRVYYQKVPGKDGGPYLMDHSSIVYLLDRNGRFVTHFTHEAKAEAITAAVGRLL